MKKSLKSILALTCICAVMALLLALTNYITAPIIADRQNAAANDALLVVMPDGKSFELVDLSAYTLPATVVEAYKEASGGYVFKLVTAGYGSDFTIMCGVLADGSVSGAVCLSSNETLGHEKTYGEKLVGTTLDTVDGVDTISGATKTTEAYRNAIKDALNSVVILGGGSVDIRTEEEILADNLDAALPAAEGEFERLFIAEVIEGIDAVYTAKNGKGSVCIIGEQFIGVNEQGSAIGEASAEQKALVEAQMAILNASKVSAIDLAQYADVHKNVISAQKTESGNYILEIKGAGYGIVGGDDYHPASGEYIVIRVSLTADGKIIDCLTVSQKETQGLGDACADEKFYGQFDGKTEENYTQIDAITGATMTTDGYKKAILRAFETVKILEGGAQE